MSRESDAAGAAQVFDVMSSAVLALDLQGRILWENTAAQALFGRSERGLAGERLALLLPEAREWLERLAAGGEAQSASAVFVGTAHDVYRSAAGGGQRVQASLTTLGGRTFGILPEGSAILAELISLDETIEKDRESQSAALMEANRQLLRNLAHEVKNPLGGIRGAAQLLESELTGPEDRECTAIIIEECDRLQALVDRLLAPYRRGAAREEVNVHEVLEHVRSLIALEFPKGLRFVRDYDISAPSIVADRARLTQVFLNIVRNAAEAMAAERERGEAVITLRTRIVRDVLAGGERKRRGLAVDVADNGPGVPEALREKIMYPLVTGRAEGSGLGLSLAQTFVRQAGGTLTFESVPGRTVFRAVFPLE